MNGREDAAGRAEKTIRSAICSTSAPVRTTPFNHTRHRERGWVVAGASMIFFLLTFVSSIKAGGTTVSDYRLFTAIGQSQIDKKTCVILRKFRMGNQTYYLTVNPQDLITQIRPSKELKATEAPLVKIEETYKDSLFSKTVDDAERHSDLLQDAGITRSLPRQTGVNLTIDLCPSARPLDRNLFMDLIKEFGVVETPVPIAVSLTGVWMEGHPDDLAWLLDLVKQGRISILWINHSYHHRSGSNLPLKRNFLLEKGTNINFEVLQTEAKMIEHGIVPSVFFRFPGLVSDSKIFQTITNFGLIPVGSDAWLSKNQRPKDGSIVLIHANGNDPIGIKRFLTLIRKERAKIMEREWLLFDLRESIVETEALPHKAP